MAGSPPLTRETLTFSHTLSSPPRITPAYAGNTYMVPFKNTKTRDHPRLRGKHVVAVGALAGLAGSPPLTRETLQVCSVHELKFRITPAYAGNTPAPETVILTLQDHPRLCGKHLPHAVLNL